MRFELDPDLWFFTRLTVRRWRWALLVAGGIYMLVLLSAWSPNSRVRFVSDNAYGNDGFVLVSFFLIIMTGWSPVPAFAALERNGQFDWTRLGGRAPGRTLMMFVAGVVWPMVLVISAVLGINAAAFHGGPAVWWVGAWFFAVALDLALIVIRWLPVSASPTIFFGLIALPAVVAPAVALSSWGRVAAVDWRGQLAAAIVLGTLPLAMRLAVGRLARPANRRTWIRLREVTVSLARIVPRDGQAELLRQLRANVTSAAGLGVVLTIVTAAIATIRWSPFPGVRPFVMYLSITPHVTLFVGALAVMATVGQEIESKTIDLLRLTPQASEAVALGWYGGIMLPFWALALLFATAFNVVASGPLLPLPDVWWWALGGFGILFPAILLLTALQRGVPGGWILSAMVVWIVAGLYSSQQVARTTFMMRPVANVVVMPWDLNIRLLFPVCATVMALGGASRLIGLAEGPALAGPGAVAAIAVAALAVRIFPVYAYPRVVTGMLPLLAGFLAEDRDAPTPPWRRLAVAGGSALVAVSVVTWEARVGSDVSILTGIAAALALGIGILGHELSRRRPVISAALPPAIMFAVFRFQWQFNGLQRRPALFDTSDVTALAAAFAALAWWHARRRADAASNVSVT
jgi:hypothetical protein